MCIASEYLNEIESLTKRLDIDNEKLSKKLSEYDRKVNEKYHQIEVSNFNASEGYYLAKQLQELLRKRRLVKAELHKLQVLTDGIKKKDIVKTFDKTRNSICKYKNTKQRHNKEWKYTYKIEELLNGKEQAYKIN